MATLPRMKSADALAALAVEGGSGRYWYQHAEDQIRRASDMIGVEPERFAGVLACLSPRVSVLRNVRLTLRYLQTGEHGPGVMRCVRESVAHYEATGEIRGPKTRPFAYAVLGDPDAVVLDVWMAKALGVPQARLSSKRVHAKASDRVRSAARTVGYTPAQCQAAVWYAAVRRAGRNPGRLTIVHDTLFGPKLEKAA